MDVDTPEAILALLRSRADEDFLAPAAERQPGRHQRDLLELGVRVSLTRARYPNRPGGADLYVATVSRLALDRPPDPGDVRQVLVGLFGDAAGGAEERPLGPLVRSYRVPAASPGPAGSGCP